MTEEGPEECHDKEIETLIDVPEEVCDLNPQKTCRLFVHNSFPSLFVGVKGDRNVDLANTKTHNLVVLLCHFLCNTRLAPVLRSTYC